MKFQQHQAHRLARALIITIAAGAIVGVAPNVYGAPKNTATYSMNDDVKLPPHDKKAVEKLTREANSGNAKAAHDLGTLYLWGGGLKQDFKASEKWFRKAAEAGNRDAQLYLAGGYGEGYGLTGALPRDPVEGLRWYLVAGKVKMDPRLEVFIALAKQKMTPDQVADAERRASSK